MAEGGGTVNRWRRKYRNDYGLKPCPKCGRLNGWLQRGAGNRCAIGVGCNKGSGHVIGRPQ